MGTMESQSFPGIDVGPARAAWTPSEVKCSRKKSIAQLRRREKKNMKWKEMADHISSEGSGAGRTVAHLKKKIRDIKYNVKAYFDEKKYPKTGGGNGLKKIIVSLLRHDPGRTK